MSLPLCLSLSLSLSYVYNDPFSSCSALSYRLLSQHLACNTRSIQRAITEILFKPADEASAAARRRNSDTSVGSDCSKRRPSTESDVSRGRVQLVGRGREGHTCCCCCTTVILHVMRRFAGRTFGRSFSPWNGTHHKRNRGEGGGRGGRTCDRACLHRLPLTSRPCDAATERSCAAVSLARLAFFLG